MLIKSSISVLHPMVLCEMSLMFHDKIGSPCQTTEDPGGWLAVIPLSDGSCRSTVSIIVLFIMRAVSFEILLFAPP